MDIFSNIEAINNAYLEKTKGFFSFDSYNLAMITAHSTRIEGSQLLLKDVISLQQNQHINNADIISIHMVNDHAKALEYVLDQSLKKNVISEDIIKEICKLVIANTGSEKISSIAGDFSITNADYRLVTVHAGPVTFVDYKKVPELMKELVIYINDRLTTIEDVHTQYTLSYIAHYDLVQIHPFGDGNGRTARLLMNYIQSYFDLPLTAIMPEDKSKYFKALNNARAKNDKGIFISFMAKAHVKFIKKQLKLMDELKAQEKNNTDTFEIG